MPKYLIVTADDFGYSSGRNKGIVEAFQSGVVTRTSLMVNSVKAEEAVSLAKQCHLPMGLHLNLTEGFPVSDPSLVQSLLDEKTGTFLGKLNLSNAVAEQLVNLEEVEVEIKSQLARFRELTGEWPSVVDGHQHAHIIPGISEVFARCNIKETRLPFEPDIKSHDWLQEKWRPFFDSVNCNSTEARNIFTKHGVQFTSRFCGLTTMGKNMTLERLERIISTAFDDVTCDHVTCELMTHPGFPTQGNCAVSDEPLVDVVYQSDLKHVAGCGQGPDDFEQSADRQHEINILCNPTLKQWINKHNITLIESVSQRQN